VTDAADFEAVIAAERTALRSSVWLRSDGMWRVLFHQATSVQAD
jgi:hypothetical protein